MHFLKNLFLKPIFSTWNSLFLQTLVLFVACLIVAWIVSFVLANWSNPEAKKSSDSLDTELRVTIAWGYGFLTAAALDAIDIMLVAFVSGFTQWMDLLSHIIVLALFLLFALGSQARLGKAWKSLRKLTQRRQQ